MAQKSTIDYTSILNDASFVAACEKANIQKTKRQVRKWLKGQGAAYKAHTEQK